CRQQRHVGNVPHKAGEPTRLVNCRRGPYNPRPHVGPRARDKEGGPRKMSKQHRVGSPFLVGLAASALLLPLGCNALRMNLLGDPDKTPRPTDKDAAVVAPPSKYSLRVSQFVFLSDFELKQDLP